MSPFARMVLVWMVFALQAAPAWTQDGPQPDPAYPDTTPTTLPDLYREAKMMGLPMPPRGARLAARNQFEGGYSIPVTNQDLDFGLFCFVLTEQPKFPRYTVLWGVKIEEYWLSDMKIWDPPPDPKRFAQAIEQAKKTQKERKANDSHCPMEMVYPSLLLALQCHAAGHGDLAQWFFERAKAESTTPLEQVLFTIGWNHWVEKACVSRENRRDVLEKLTWLVGRFPKWKEPLCDNLVKDLTDTIRKDEQNEKYRSDPLLKLRKYGSVWDFIYYKVSPILLFEICGPEKNEVPPINCLSLHIYHKGFSIIPDLLSSLSDNSVTSNLKQASKINEKHDIVRFNKISEAVFILYYNRTRSRIRAGKSLTGTGGVGSFS